jgi:hypothetical protein
MISTQILLHPNKIIQNNEFENLSEAKTQCSNYNP